MSEFLRTCLCLSVVLFGGCAFLSGEREHLVYPLDDSNWRVGYSSAVPGADQITEFVRKGETVENWTELHTVMNFVGTPSTTPEAVMNGAKAQMEQRCPGVTWKVLEQQETAILYEWKTGDCPSSPNHHSVALLLDGRWNRWFIAYEIKVKNWPETERSVWIGVLSKARVVDGPKVSTAAEKGAATLPPARAEVTKDSRAIIKTKYGEMEIRFFPDLIDRGRDAGCPALPECATRARRRSSGRC